jgi:DNA-binding NarL/FixJ family response regulator
MSKQRPSGVAERPAREASRPRSLGFHPWARRLFRNSYTRDGRRIRLRGWSVKIQHEGRRHTFSLGPVPRAVAAKKAYALYRTLVTQGWDAALGHRFARPRRACASGGAGAAETQPRYWRPRLLTRRYTEGLRAHRAGELSVRIEHEGESHYFPLGSGDERLAARAAVGIYRTVLTGGWPLVKRTFPREITVAVFWATSPLACTYTTLYTEIAGPGPRPFGPARDPAGVVCIVEGDEGVRRALASCVAAQLKPWDVATLSTGGEALRVRWRPGASLVLLDRGLPDMAGGECAEILRARYADLPVFTYGVYGDSDQLFLSFSGVNAGYILRRRPPALLLEPIAPLAAMRSCSTERVAHRVKRYFQAFFHASPVQEAQATARLTPREEEILECLSKGYVDKEIAQRLGISPWTVHGHLRSIFEKFQVHTRTEAAVKYLQK